MEHYKVVHGVKLFERKCKGFKCPNTFFVPKSSPQHYCSCYCHESMGIKTRYVKPSKNLKTTTLKLKRSDYEES